MFLRNELKSITAGGWGKRLTLPFFVFLAMLGVAFASSGLKYLSEKMDDPYVKWLDLPVTREMERDQNYERTKDSLDTWAGRNAYFLGDYQGYYRFPMRFFGSADDRESVLGRTVDPVRDTLLLNRILGRMGTEGTEQIVLDFRDSLLEATGSEVAMWKKGLVITEELYRKLFDDADPRKVAVQKGTFLTPVLDIIAVVNRLPSRSEFLCSPSLQWSLTKPVSETKFQHDSRIDSLALVVSLPDGKVNELRQRLLDSDWLKDAENVEVAAWNRGVPSHNARAVIRFREPVNLLKRHEVFKLLKEESLRGMKPLMDSRYTFRKTNAFEQSGEQRGGVDRDKFNWLCLQFTDLAEIRPFSERILTDLEIELDLNKVESLENYRIVALLTRILGSLLFLFALACVVIFVANLVNSHLESIKENLGTFRAFGITKSFLIRLYALIIGIILGVSIALSAVVLLIINLLGVFRSLLSSLRFDDALVEMNLRLADPWVALMVIILCSSAILTAVFSAHRILRHPPGDLIYKRT